LLAESKGDGMNCANCQHPEKSHCKGGVKHGLWSDERKQNGIQPRTVVCPSRHCDIALCCCVAFEPQPGRALTVKVPCGVG
jgi:hypothetical protein